MCVVCVCVLAHVCGNYVPVCFVIHAGEKFKFGSPFGTSTRDAAPRVVS